MSTINKAADVSDQVIEAVKKGQEAALEAVRTFVDTVDKAVPFHTEPPTKRQEIIDSAFHMAERLVEAQHEFVQNVVRSAARTLGGEKKGETPEEKKG